MAAVSLGESPLEVLLAGSAVDGLGEGDAVDGFVELAVAVVDRSRRCVCFTGPVRYRRHTPVAGEGGFGIEPVDVGDLSDVRAAVRAWIGSGSG